MLMSALWRSVFALYFVFLSWQLLTPVTIIVAGSWDKLYHFAAFGTLAGLAILAWQKLPTRSISVVLIIYAALTEILQHFIVGRSFSVMDWLADTAGVMVAVLIVVKLLERVKFLNTRYS